MKRFLLLSICFSLFCIYSTPLFAGEEYKGIIHARPDGTAGNWIIGDRVFKATEKTKLDEDNGPLKVGVCAEVEVEKGFVEEIESEPMKKCQK